MKRFVMRVLRNMVIALTIVFVCSLILFFISPVFIRPYTITIEYLGNQISFMPYTSYSWHIKAGKEGLFIATPSRSDPINVIFTGTSQQELEQVFRSLCWSKAPSVRYPFSWQRLYGGWNSHGPALEFRYIYESNPERGYHIRIFNIEKKSDEQWFVAAAHQEYYDEHARGHIVISWEEAERFVKDEIARNDLATASETVQINQPFWNEKENNGQAVLIDFSKMDFSKLSLCKK